MAGGYAIMEPGSGGAKPEDIDAAEATFRLRLAEADIYRAHVKSLRSLWSTFAIVSWLLTLGALTMALAPYLGPRFASEIPSVISYVSAFVVVIAAVFALVSSYRAVIAAGLVSYATLQIERARAVEDVFGIKRQVTLSQ